MVTTTRSRLSNAAQCWAIQGLVLASSLALCSCAMLQAHERPLAAFNKVEISVPFNVVVKPAKQYAVKCTAESQVTAALDISVSKQTLHLSTHGAFKSQQPIFCTVTLPANALQAVNVLSSNILVALAAGFSPHAFSLSVSGASKFVAKGLRAANTAVSSTG